MRKRWWLLALVLFGCVAILPAQAPTPAVQVFFGPRAATDRAGLYFNLCRFIDSAQKTLHGSVHEVDMHPIAQKLVAKADAGVDVQLAIEADWWKFPKNTAARKVLEESKVKVVLDSKKSGLQHNKFFIADGVRVWTGSTNLTETCLLFNPNNALWIESPELAANYKAEFDLQIQGLFGRKAKSGKFHKPHASISLDGLTIRSYFSPQEDTLKPIIQLIESSKHTIDVMAFVFSSADVGKALIKAHERGVKVRVLLDNALAPPAITKRWPFAPFAEFKKAGIAVKFDDEDAKLHHKVFIVDGQTTITGSLNFSVSAVTDNEENMLIIEGKPIAQKYHAEFERLWAYFSGDPGQPPPPEAGDDP